MIKHELSMVELNQLRIVRLQIARELLRYIRLCENGSLCNSASVDNRLIKVGYLLPKVKEELLEQDRVNGFGIKVFKSSEGGDVIILTELLSYVGINIRNKSELHF